MNDIYERMANTANSWQGSTKRVLCLCSAGLLRSPTAANVIHQTWGYNTRAAGVVSYYALILMDDVLLHWAQEIVVMDDDIEQAVKVEPVYKANPVPIRNLHVPDRFGWNDHSLREAIKDAYAEFENDGSK